MPIAATVASAIVEFRARGAEYRREVRRTAESTGEIRRELARADRAIQSFNRRTGALVRRLGSIRTAAAAAASVAGFGALAKRIADSVATIEHMAGVAGQTAEQLQVLEFAASQVGVATRNTQIGMQRFNRRLGEARTGAGVLAPVLDRMGIALKNADGTFRSSNQVLRDFADGIQRLNDPGQQLLAAFRAFDSEGAKLVLALRGGSSGLDAMASEAKRLGLILDPELVQAAVKLSDEFDRFTTIVRRNFQRIVLEYAPNLISALEGLGRGFPHCSTGCLRLSDRRRARCGCSSPRSSAPGPRSLRPADFGRISWPSVGSVRRREQRPSQWRDSTQHCAYPAVRLVC